MKGGLIGELGIIQYSDDSNKIQCHICGKYFKHLCSSHVPRIHHMTAYEYKKEFGLCNNSGLVGKETSELYRIKFKPNLTSTYRAKGGNLRREGTRLQTRKQISKSLLGRRTRWHEKLIRQGRKRFQQFEKLKAMGLSGIELAKILGFKSPKAFWKKLSKMRRIYYMS